MLADIDLRSDPAAAFYLKHEVVDVVFATEPGELISREGPNRYQPGDALITSRGGDRWCVSRDRFDPKYEAVPPLAHGQDGAYRNKPVPVLRARCTRPSASRAAPAATCCTASRATG